MMAEVIRMTLTQQECVEGKVMIAEHRDFVKRVKDEDLFVNSVEGYVRTKAAGMVKGDDIITKLDDARIKDMVLFDAVWSAMCTAVCEKIAEMDEQIDKLEEEIARRERMGFTNEDQ